MTMKKLIIVLDTFGFPKGERGFFDARFRRAFGPLRVVLHILLNLFQGLRSKDFSKTDIISHQIKSTETYSSKIARLC